MTAKETVQALYAAYASDFGYAQTEATRAAQMSPLGNLPLARYASASSRFFGESAVWFHSAPSMSSIEMNVGSPPIVSRTSP